MLNADISHFRLACYMPNQEDGTSYHRALGPLGAMARSCSRLELHLPARSRDGRGANLDWDWLAHSHALFVQRPYRAVHLQMCKQAKAMGLPIWAEWDDQIWSVPRSNPSYAAYQDQDQVKEVIDKITDLADVVTTATAPLAKALGPKAEVVPNAAHTKFYSEPRQRRVAWRGSATHDADVATVLPELHELSRLPQFSRWAWHFSGGAPWAIYETIPPSVLEVSGGTGPVFFVPFFGLVAPWCMFVPLQNSFFNQCKSNLAWIEGTCAGCVVLGPDWEEWRRPGIINFTSPKDFKDKLRAVIADFKEGSFHPNVEISRAYISENLTLEIVNRKRWDILNRLMKARDL